MRSRSLVFALVLAPALAGRGRKLDEGDATAIVEAELRRPVREFCCSRIESSAARAACESRAEAECGFAANGKARATDFGNYAHGDVAMGDFAIKGPKGEGSWARGAPRARVSAAAGTGPSTSRGAQTGGCAAIRPSARGRLPWQRGRARAARRRPQLIVATSS